MFHILGIGFFFILILFIVGLMILVRLINATGSFIGSIFRPFSKKRNYGQQQSESAYYHQSQDYDNEQPAKRNNKKVFGDDEGEYVEFEEIKE